MWLFYTLVFALSGLAVPTNTPISSTLGTVYMALGMITWLSLESVQQISRVMHITITFTLATTLVTVIYLSAYVWQDDEVLADLNGVGVPGNLTRYAIQRACYLYCISICSCSWQDQGALQKPDRQQVFRFD